MCLPPSDFLPIFRGAVFVELRQSRRCLASFDTYFFLIGIFANLEASLRVVPICPDYVGVLVCQSSDVDLVLLRALVLHVVAERAREEDLGKMFEKFAHNPCGKMMDRF